MFRCHAKMWEGAVCTVEKYLQVDVSFGQCTKPIYFGLEVLSAVAMFCDEFHIAQ